MSQPPLEVMFRSAVVLWNITFASIYAFRPLKCASLRATFAFHTAGYDLTKQSHWSASSKSVLLRLPYPSAIVQVYIEAAGMYLSWHKTCFSTKPPYFPQPKAHK